MNLILVKLFMPNGLNADNDTYRYSNCHFLKKKIFKFKFKIKLKLKLKLKF